MLDPKEILALFRWDLLCHPILRAFRGGTLKKTPCTIKFVIWTLKIQKPTIILTTFMTMFVLYERDECRLVLIEKIKLRGHGENNVF